MTRSFKEPAGKSKEGLLPSHAESGPEIDFVHEEIRKDSLSRSYREQKAKYIYISRELLHIHLAGCMTGTLTGDRGSTVYVYVCV